MESLENLRTLGSERIPPEQKLELAKPLKERGNALFREEKYQDAKRAYDEAFVCMFCTQEEFEYLFTTPEKQKHQELLVTLHLNRGLCKLKLKDLEAAKWDFEEAQRYARSLQGPGSKGNAKALYRRARTLIEMVRLELEKAERREHWDDEKALECCSSSENDLREAAAIEPADSAIPRAMQELSRLRTRILELRRAHRVRSKQFFSKLKIDRKPKLHNSENARPAESVQKEDMLDADRVSGEHTEVMHNVPALERVRIY
ncbi:hypothetical protein CCYA_CCYA12G3380 [Cyanidiococcus yangmingshanensis]|uniref:Uncharacterized protein n=1 Tax=Cyanidiococcus yangmingshanensis TaxID=2690220 RepID=A0A7J7IFL8_9RHOD|nr:hypothetical protein F1559_001224 [Cyanidiococcus yangmingshanensis]KAK4532523.1 hypothetical protein CCYA_CCYA12G3380 [Cyanidiococcus yangmingshanensis]